MIHAMKACIRWGVIGLMAILLGGGGCATPRSSPGVQLRLVNVSLQSGTLWETTASFTVRLQNEMPDAITLTGGVYKFYLDGVLVGDGLFGETVTLPRLSSTTQDIPVYLRNLALARRIKPLLEQRRLAYRVESVLYVVRNGGERRVRFSGTGELDLNEFSPTPPAAP